MEPMCNFLLTIIGPMLGALIGGAVSLYITKKTFNREDKESISELLLILRESRYKINKIHEKIKEEYQKAGLGIGSNNEINTKIRDIICDSEYSLRPVTPIFQRKGDKVLTFYSKDYSALSKIVEQIDMIESQQSDLKKGKQNEQNPNEFNEERLDSLYNYIEELYGKITDKYILNRLNMDK